MEAGSVLWWFTEPLLLTGFAVLIVGFFISVIMDEIGVPRWKLDRLYTLFSIPLLVALAVAVLNILWYVFRTIWSF